MSVLCDMALAFGLTLGGTCQPATAPQDPMPADDPAAWSYREPKPEPKIEEPKPLPKFPPVIIRKEVIREVPASVPAPPLEPKPEPEPEAVVEPEPPSAVELAIRAAYRSRTAGLTAWPQAVIPASLIEEAGALNTKGSRGSTFRALPLDLASFARDQHPPNYEAPGVVSSRPVDNTRIVAAGRYITGILETVINTQLDGTSGATTVIQVSRDVYGYHGRNVLIPKGSRLLCAFQSPDRIGDARAAMRCGRILLGESRAEIFGLKANVTDQQGQLGVSGYVDTRFMERFGTAFILAGISAAVRGATASSSALEILADNSDSLSTSGEELAENLGEIAASSLEQTVNLNPILKIAQGTRVQIRPAQDWYIAQTE